MRPPVLLTLMLAVSVISARPQSRSVAQFGFVLACTIPGSNPLKFNDYGCYCGLGGSGTPVDELDRCCQTHDNCYSESKTAANCRFLFDSPYLELYSYTCENNTVTCSSKNNPCEMFLCECDRKAALCFSQAPYNEENKGKCPSRK